MHEQYNNNNKTKQKRGHDVFITDRQLIVKSNVFSKQYVLYNAAVKITNKRTDMSFVSEIKTTFRSWQQFWMKVTAWRGNMQKIPARLPMGGMNECVHSAKSFLRIQALRYT